MSRSITYIALAACLSACGAVAESIDAAGGGDEELPVILPVLANAGADREILRGYTARLDGRGTRVPAGATLTVHWEQIEGPQVFLSNVADLSPSFVAPLDEVRLSFRLTTDDGHWVTTDEVTLFAKKSPLRRAPRLRAAADRYVDFGEELEPQHDDVVQVAPEGTPFVWSEVLATPSAAAALGAEQASELTARIYKVEAEADGLHSAPDHLVLLPFDQARRGEVPPTCGLSAPAVVQPGQSVTLDAACSDANNDGLGFRWEQLGGEPVTLPTAKSGPITAPARVGELVFRVAATDGGLESSVADVVVVVSPSEGATAPEVAPRHELMAHAGNKVWIDALPSVGDGASLDFMMVAADAPVYTWTQTFGPALSPSYEAGGRVMWFAAPVLPGTDAIELAFAVAAEQDGIASTPATTRITVLPETTNVEPQVELCAPTSVPSAEQPVSVAVRVVDPEGDTLVAPIWGDTVGLVENPPDATPPNCVVAGDPPASWQEGDVPTLTVSVPAAAPGESVTVDVVICDALGECGQASAVIATAVQGG